MNDAVTSQARNHRAQKVIFVHNRLIYVSSIRVNQNWRMCCILVPRLRIQACLRSHAAHPEYNLHRVLASSIKLKCANNLEVKIKPWPTQVESNDLMDQTGWLESQSAAHESAAGRGQRVSEQGAGAAPASDGRRYFGMMSSWVKLGSDSGRWMTKSIRSTCILILERAKHRQETTPGLHVYTCWALGVIV